jgi:hypothetical protein
MHRERVLHGLGNLTLVNDRLNPTLSNGPWKPNGSCLPITLCST